MLRPRTRNLAALALMNLILLSCGPTSTPPEDNDTGTGGAGETTLTSCVENYPSAISTTGNVYVFEAEPTDCIGVQETTSLKKSVPLTIRILDVDNSIPGSPEFEYESEIRLTLRKSGINVGGFDLYATLNFTNNSTSDYCFDAENIELLDSDGIAIDTTTNLNDGRSGALINGINDTRRRCLPAGETHVFIADAALVQESQFNRISSAVIPEIELDEVKYLFDIAPSISAEMLWLNPGNGNSNIPTLQVTWTNTESETIRIDDDAQRVWFMDTEGYILSESYIYLDDYLGIDDSELMPEDFLIVPGGTITLEDSDADNAYVGLSPSSASRALVFLDWWFD
ncbi:hypothetical protein [Reinekea blandensis]|uniref:hypothetical protein n=1 Tax=Reinekea blandensis TaxID=374838 RepID=UPI0002E5B1A7|nr:hypothetical protein [Reinekea blandensis]